MTETIVLGGGCFWCTEAVIKRLRGVISTMSGYAGGHVANPTYEQVVMGNTGHVEVIRIEYDPDEITLETIVDVFLVTHDPTSVDRQGADAGSQYKSIVLYNDDKQKKIVEAVIERMEGEKVYDFPIVTEARKLEAFYPAESYHQGYYDKNPDLGYCRMVISPKLAMLRQKFLGILKK